MQIEKHVLYLSGAFDGNDRSKTNSGSAGSMEEHQIPCSSGYYFPEIVLFQVICDRKYVYSDSFDRHFKLKLTSEAISNIPIANILKIKLYGSKLPDKVDLKLQTEEREYHFYISENDIIPMFSKLLWLRLATMNIYTEEIQPTEQEISGQVMRKTDAFSGKWETVPLKISKKNGLILGKSTQPIAKAKQIKELWTRLEVVENSQYLVIKTFLGFSKYQLGIPVKNGLMKWIHAFCSLLLV